MRVFGKCLVIFILLTTFFTSGCVLRHLLTAQPDEDGLIKVFDENFEYFEIVADRLPDQGYDACFISIFLNKNVGQLFAGKDFKYHDITDQKLKEAVEELFNAGCEIIDMGMESNCIEFELWHNDQDVACGVLYNYNGVESPHVMYMTQIRSLDRDGWYFYTSDYNKWRSEHSNKN